MLCPNCLGDGCGECNTGFIKQERKPRDLITAEGVDLFDAYRWLKNYNQFPAPGGYMDQAAAFVEAVEWCDAVHSAYAGARDRKNAEVSKLQANLQKMIGNNAIR